MTYKTILTHLNGSASLSSRVRVAAKLARRHNAHLVGVAPAGVAMMPGNIYLSVTNDLLIELQDRLDHIAAQAISEFEEICKEVDVDSVESRPIGNDPSDTMLIQARYCDLVVIGQADPKGEPQATDESFVERVVLSAGKPVIVVPTAGTFGEIGRRVLFAWDGSREAARAVTDSMPILASADLVEVVVINAKSPPGGDQGPTPGADIALYLARHGVTAEVRNIRSNIDVGNTLLSHAADFGADLIVMGAYGHSKVREWVMGGTTKTLLQSMTVPVLMSH